MSKRTFAQSSSSDWKGGKVVEKKKSKKSGYNKMGFFKGATKPEMQFYDEINSLAPTNVTTGASGIVSLLQGMTQGVGAAQFQGNKITIKAIYVRMLWSNADTSPSACRYALVLDNRPTGTGGVPAFNDVFKLAYIAGTTQNSPVNLDEQRGRWTILRDDFLVLGDTGGLKSTKQKEWYVKVNIPFEWNTGPNPSRYDIYFVSLSSRATSPPGVTVQSRIRYINN